MSKLPLLTIMASLACLALVQGEMFEVRNTEGRALMIELLELDGKNVVFSTAKGGKEHTLALDKFDADSQEKIRTASKSLKARIPAITTDVAIANRRVKDGYYMVNQTVSAKVKIRNTNTKIAFPESTGTLIYLGRNRRYPDQYQILGIKTFTVSIGPNGSFEEEVAGIKTRYDSDNKGSGNAGGYQFDGYLLVISDKENQILHTKTSEASLKSILDRDTTIAGKMIKLKAKDILDKTFEKLDPREAY